LIPRSCCNSRVGRAVCDALREVESAIDRQIAELHTTWVGVGADAQRQYHEVWLRAADEMRRAVAELRANAAVAHVNYIDAGEINTLMWG
jgi:uncharacterized protein YukE